MTTPNPTTNPTNGGELAQIRAFPSKNEPELPVPDFVHIEANLASLGFFTPSNKKIKNVKKKTVRITKTVDGQREEKRVTIIPTAIHGLPVTADQDKFMAFLKILRQQKRDQQRVTNPIPLTTAELLNLLGKTDAGKNYREVKQWLQRMTGTLLISEQAVFFAGRKEWKSATFHVFQGVVTKGSQMEDGTIAEKHYVFLSDWQLENINQNYMLPIDWEGYRQLKNHISKALIFPLQILLYATQEQGRTEKRYDELCRFLGIRQYNYPSKIKEKLGPSLDELVAYGYLKRWKVEKTTDKKAYKLIFWHGEKFYSDQKRRLSGESSSNKVAEQAEPEPAPIEEGSASNPVADRLTKKWGIPKDEVVELFSGLPPDQPVAEQLEYLEHILATQGVGYERDQIRTPGAFLKGKLRKNIPIPEWFVSPAKAQAERDAQEARQAAAEQLLQDHESYLRDQAAQYIEQNTLENEYEVRRTGKLETLRKYKHKDTTEVELAKSAREWVLDEFAKELNLGKGFDEWRADQPQPAAAAS